MGGRWPSHRAANPLPTLPITGSTDRNTTSLSSFDPTPRSAQRLARPSRRRHRGCRDLVVATVSPRVLRFAVSRRGDGGVPRQVPPRSRRTRRTCPGRRQAPGARPRPAGLRRGRTAGRRTAARTVRRLRTARPRELRLHPAAASVESRSGVERSAPRIPRSPARCTSTRPGQPRSEHDDSAGPDGATAQVQVFSHDGGSFDGSCAGRREGWGARE